ncbi:MAG: AMP-binding protein [Microthrixaceae bacterium]
MFLHEIIEFAARAHPDDPALIGEGHTWTFAEMWDRVTSMAGAISRRTSRGDRVVIISENSPAMVAALYALPLAGTVATFANTRHTPSEIAELIRATEPSLVLASAVQMSKLVDTIEFDAITARLSVETELLEDFAGPIDGRPGEKSDRTTPARVARLGADSDCAWLIHTSGTTGRAKGAVLTHRSLISAVMNTAVARPLSDDDVYLFPFPLFHVAAYNVLHSHIRRRPVVLVPGFDPAQVLSLIESERVTSCSLAPTMLSMLLDHPDRGSRDLSSLRQVSYGAASMPLDLILRVEHELPGCGLAQGYGMTELSGNAVFLTPADHDRARTTDPHLLAAAGRPGPLVALRIVGEDDRDVAPGEPGEILVRGDQVCDGYWNAPEETSGSLLDGWFRTGDIGRVDPEGVLDVVDRKKDLIISGGENVSSREVEDLLSTHPHVAQVAVVGLPDQRWGEKVCAVVVASRDNADALEIVDWTKGRIAGFKRPRAVFFSDSLPTNASGKVDKVALRMTFESAP